MQEFSSRAIPFLAATFTLLSRTYDMVMQEIPKQAVCVLALNLQSRRWPSTW